MAYLQLSVCHMFLLLLLLPSDTDGKKPKPETFSYTCTIEMGDNSTVTISATVDVLFIRTVNDTKLYMVKLYNIKVKNMNKDGEEEENGDKPFPVDARFKWPFRFVQRADGSIAEVQFHNKDKGKKKIRNFKRGIVTAFQTRSSSDDDDEVDEVDQIGLHTTNYTVVEKGKKGHKLKKKYKIKNAGGAEIDAEEEQTVENGRVVNAKGNVKLKPNKKERKKGDKTKIPVDVTIEADDSPLGEGLDVRASYTLKKEKGKGKDKKRSLDEYTERWKRDKKPKDKDFDSGSLQSEIDEDEDVEELMERWQKAYAIVAGMDIIQVIQDYLDNKNNETQIDSLNPIKDVLFLEAKLRFNCMNKKELKSRDVSPMITAIVKKTKKVLKKCFPFDDIRCIQLIHLYTIGEGKPAEKALISILKREHLPTNATIAIVTYISVITCPTKLIAKHLEAMLKASDDEDIKAAVLLALAALAGETCPCSPKSFKETIYKLLSKKLLKLKGAACGDNNPIELIDMLEAVGNMGDERFIDMVIGISKKCTGKPAVQIACVHALRENVGNEKVQNWLQKIMDENNCDVKEAILNVLREIIAGFILENPVSMTNLPSEGIVEEENDNGEWPTYGFNDFDRFLEEKLLDMADKNFTDYECISEDLQNYFDDKIGKEAEDVLKKFKGVIPRAIEHASCSNWHTYGGRYSAIQSGTAFFLDNIRYPRNSHCLAHFSAGGSRAKTYIKGGVFAGRHWSYCNFKVFTKIYADGHIFGRRFLIGVTETHAYKYYGIIYFRGYVRVGSRTFLDYRRVGHKSYFIYSYSASTPGTWSWYIKVYRLHILFGHIDVGVTIYPRFSLKIIARLCSGCGVYTGTEVTTHVMIRGSASAYIAFFYRIGINIYAYFNYYLQLRGQSGLSGVCVQLWHGHSRMYIRIQAWYQRRWWWRWGQIITFTPLSQTWSIGSKSKSLIYSNCGMTMSCAVPAVRGEA